MFFMEKKPMNLDTMTFETPVAPAAATEKKVEEKKKEETPDPDDDDEKDKKKVEVKVESKKKEDEPGDDKSKEKPKKTEQDDDGGNEPEETTPDEFIKNTFGEKYDIESQEELEERLEIFNEVVEENKELKKQLKEVEKNPKFDSDAEKKAYEFVKEYGVERVTDGTYAALITMDPDKTDKRILLEEQFIMEHDEYTRDEAKRKFKKVFDKEFGPLNEDDFKTPEEFKEAQEERELDLKAASEKAKKAIKKYQADFKGKPNDKKEDKTVVNEAIQKSIATNAKEFEKELAELETIDYSLSDDPEEDFSVQFKKDQLKAIRAVCESWVKNPVNYNEKGELIAKMDPETVFLRAARMLYGEEIEGKLIEHTRKVYSIKRAEEISEQTPASRKAKGPSATGVALSEDEQLQKLIEEKKNKKKAVTA